MLVEWAVLEQAEELERVKKALGKSQAMQRGKESIAKIMEQFAPVQKENVKVEGKIVGKAGGKVEDKTEDKAESSVQRNVLDMANPKPKPESKVKGNAVNVAKPTQTNKKGEASVAENIRYRNRPPLLL